MKSLLAFLLCGFFACPVFAIDDYKLGPDSSRQDGVPQGKVTTFVWTNSAVYPGTSRQGWVYVPAQYDGSKPAAVMVFQDGRGQVDEKGHHGIPTIFDNLIARGEMPVTIGIFLNPGTFGDGADNRSFEYDSMSGQYAKFICDEILPHFAKEYNLTTDPEMRAIEGGSSGGICAFTVAWERPDVFHKVMSAIGSFTNIRGGDAYPGIIRKTERKPIRVFLQDGSNDLNNLFGNWPLSSQQMASALQFMGYDVRFEFGDGKHSGKHINSIMPDALRWLWRPATTLPWPLSKDNLGGDEALSKVLPEDSKWELVGEGYRMTDAACGDADGNFYFCDTPNATIWRVPTNGVPEKWLDQELGVSGLKFGPDGRLYATAQKQGTVKPRIVAIDTATKAVSDIATDVNPNDLAVTKAGWIYFTDTSAGQVQMISTSPTNSERPQTVAGGILGPNGITLSPNQKFLAVSEFNGKNVWFYSISTNGQITAGEPYMTMRLPFDKTTSSGDGMVTDAEGHYYVSSSLGIQMFDKTGRLGGVIANPNNARCLSIGFGGANREWLYACNGKQVWRRKMLTHGF
jgi:enterochelin esterase family protein